VLVDICGLHANGTILYRSILARRPAGVQVFFWVHITFFLPLHMYFVCANGTTMNCSNWALCLVGVQALFFGAVCVAVFAANGGVLFVLFDMNGGLCVCECLCVCMNETFQRCD